MSNTENNEVEEEEVVLERGDINAPTPKEKWHTLQNDVRLLTEGTMKVNNFLSNNKIWYG